MNRPLQKLWHFYRDGFRSMTVGRTLWLIILLKLIVIFVILKLFFFRGTFAGMDNREQSDCVIERLTVPNDLTQ